MTAEKPCGVRSSGRATPALFEEPFNLADITVAMEYERFWMAAYAAMAFGADRWVADVDQLGRLFMVFAESDVDAHKLYRLAALHWQWARRFREELSLRTYFRERLGFILGERLNKAIRSLTKLESGKRVWATFW